MSGILTSSKLQIASAQGLASNWGIPSWAWFLIIVLIILVVWWLLVRSAEQYNEIEAEHPDEIVVESKSSESALSIEKVAPESVQVDDLTVIEGIGPKVNVILSAAGITTFLTLAKTDTGTIKDLLDAAGYQYMDPTTWAEQAHLLAEGKKEEFERLAHELRGGRRK